MANTEESYNDTGEQMELAGLVSEATDTDPVSGNNIPLGATAEGVRDDEVAAISPGEFVIPDYAVRFHGLDFYVESLQKAQDGLQQMEGMGLVGNPDEQIIDDAAPLPSMNDETQPMLPMDIPPSEPVSSEFQTGGLQTNQQTVPYINEQGNIMYISEVDGVVQTAVPTGYRRATAQEIAALPTSMPTVPLPPVVQQPIPPQITPASQIGEPIRPTSAQPVPVIQYTYPGLPQDPRSTVPPGSPAMPRIQPYPYDFFDSDEYRRQLPGYEDVQGPGGGLPGGYQVIPYINNTGDIIYITELGGKPQGRVPPGYRRASDEDLTGDTGPTTPSPSDQLQQQRGQGLQPGGPSPGFVGSRTPEMAVLSLIKSGETDIQKTIDYVNSQLDWSKDPTDINQVHKTMSDVEAFGETDLGQLLNGLGELIGKHPWGRIIQKLGEGDLSNAEKLTLVTAERDKALVEAARDSQQKLAEVKMEGQVTQPTVVPTPKNLAEILGPAGALPGMYQPTPTAGKEGPAGQYTGGIGTFSKDSITGKDGMGSAGVAVSPDFGGPGLSGQTGGGWAPGTPKNKGGLITKPKKKSNKSKRNRMGLAVPK